MSEQRYTIKQVAGEIGRSVSWVRSQIRNGTLDPERVHGSHGEQLMFTDADIAEARSLIPTSRTSQGTVSEAYSVALRAQNVNVALREQVSRLEAEREAQARVLERLEQESERLRAERDAERERLTAAQGRIEALKAVGVWGRLTGKHRNI